MSNGKRWRLGRLGHVLIYIVSGGSLLVCLSLMRFWERSDRWNDTLTICHETAEDEVHTRRSWAFEFGRFITITWTWYRDDHLIPIQIEELQRQIEHSQAVEWEETAANRIKPYSQRQTMGFEYHVWPSGGTEHDVRIRYQPLIVLLALAPGLVLLRGAAKAVQRLRVRGGYVGQVRPAGRGVTLFAAVSFVVLLIVSTAWIESEVIGVEAQKCWQTRLADGVNAVACVRFVSDTGRLHAKWSKTLPDPRDAGPTDPSLPLTARMTYWHWQIPEFDPALLVRKRTLVGSAPTLVPARRGGAEFQVDWNDVCVEAFAAYWLPWGLCLPLPLYWLARRRGWIGRRADGLCPSCGYDLRASSTRCPECGAPIPPRTLRTSAKEGTDRNFSAAMRGRQE